MPGLSLPLSLMVAVDKDTLAPRTFCWHPGSDNMKNGRVFDVVASVETLIKLKTIDRERAPRVGEFFCDGK